MVCPSSQVSKVLLVIFLAMIGFFVYMDFELYHRIQNYPIERSMHTATSISDLTTINNLTESNTVLVYRDVSWMGCDISPLCDITVKALLLDHTNLYLFAPGAVFLDNFLSISEGQLWITPNMISIFHVFIAVISGQCMASSSLITRRIGVVLFEIRTFLDDLDGHVARTRKHIRGERSEVGSSGYYIDGLCDALGCIALLTGIFVYLKNNPPRRGYIQLQAILPVDSRTYKSDGVIYKAKVTTRTLARSLGCFSGQLLLSSIMWNRYIALYQDMLERENVTNIEYIKQNSVFRSTLFFLVGWMWRVVSVHNMVHMLLLAVFCDKLWEFLQTVQYIGFVVLICIICLTEMHILEVQHFIFHSLTGFTTPVMST